MAGRRDDRTDLGPVAHGSREPGRGAFRRSDDEHVDSAHPLSPQGLQQAALVDRSRDAHHDGALLPPKLHPVGDRPPFDVGRRPHDRGGHEQHRHRRRHRPPGRRQCPVAAHEREPPDRDSARQCRRGADLGKREAGTESGHTADPRQQQTGREVQERSHLLTHEARRYAGGEAPDHQGTGGGDGEEVGRDRGQRHTTEDGNEHRSYADLGGERHGERRRDAAGLQRRAEDGDAGARSGGQKEPDRSGEHGIDQDEGSDRQRQHPQGRDRSTQGRRHQRQAGHGDCPKHRRFPPGDHAEDDEHAAADDESVAQREPAHEGRSDDQDEGHVLTPDCLLRTCVPATPTVPFRRLGLPWRHA